MIVLHPDFSVDVNEKRTCDCDGLVPSLVASGDGQGQQYFHVIVILFVVMSRFKNPHKRALIPFLLPHHPWNDSNVVELLVLRFLEYELSSKIMILIQQKFLITIYFHNKKLSQ